MCEIPAKREQRDPDISSENQESTFFSTDLLWQMELVPNLFKQRMDTV